MSILTTLVAPFALRQAQPRADCARCTELIGAAEAALDKQLRELHGVGRRALAQVVGDNPHVERALVAGVAADAADEDVVLAGGLDRHRVAAGGRIVDDGHAGRRGQQLAGALGAQGLAWVSTLTASEWPVTTGTRMQVAETRIDWSPRILRVSLISLRSSSVWSSPAAKLPAWAAR